MTRGQAIEAVRRLALGLPAGDVAATVARLMERISATEDAEMLRDALAEMGAEALVREARP